MLVAPGCGPPVAGRIFSSVLGAAICSDAPWL